MKRPSPLQRLFERPETKELLEELSKDDHEPSPWLLATQKARECEARYDWEGAEKAYIVACDVDGHVMSQIMGYIKLSTFYSQQGRQELAFEASSKAVELASACDINIMLSQALQQKALLCLAAGRIDEAEQLTARLLENATDTEADLMHYFGLLLRARIAIKKGQFENAQADLNTVWEYIESGDEAFMMAGFQRAIGDWWTITATMHAAKGDTTAAIVALREDVKRQRIIAQLPHVEGIAKHNNLARSLWKLGKQMEAVNDPGAKHALNECRSIRESIGLSGDFS